MEGESAEGCPQVFTGRQVGERACIGYLVGLAEDDPESMTENLQMLMDNYLKATWLTLGYACRISLHGFYMMANLYLPDNSFQKVRRPDGPGWWDQYSDLVLQDPRPAELDEPYIIFPEPLEFMNEAIQAIDHDPPAGSVVVSLDVKTQPA